jgi:hypothetical protein
LINRQNRDVGATILRELLDGRITNEEFVTKFPRNCADPALNAVFYFAWGQFSDLRVHTLSGRDTPAPERRAVLERCYLFLRSDLEFEWPMPKPSIRKGLLQMLGLRRRLSASEEDYKSKGEFDVWPFIRISDYELLSRSAQ